MNRRIVDYCLVLLCAIAYNLVFTTSVYLPNPGSDSTIYQQMGLSILQGKVPYVDLFEQKGIVLFWLDAIGIALIPKGYGLLTLCIVATSLSFYLWLKTASLYINTWVRWIPVLIGVFLCALAYGDANYTEMWSLPCISYVVYLLAKYLRGDYDISGKDCFLIGVFIGLIFFIRLNNAIPIVISCLYVGFFFIQKKQFKKLWISAGYASLGFVMAVVTVISIFALQYGMRSIQDLFFGTIGYNLIYLKSYGKGVLYVNPNFIISTILVMLLFVIKRKDWRVVFYIVLSYIFAYLTMGKAYFSHYFLIIVPLAVLSSIIIVDNMSVKMIKLLVIAFGILSITGIVGVAITENPIKRIIERKVGYSGQFEAFFRTFNKTIPQNERNDIWNYSGRMMGANILRLNQITQCNRIMLKSPDNHILKEKVELTEYKPLWVIVNPDKPYYEEGDSLFIWSNYQPIMETEISSGDDVVFLRLIEEK